MVVGVDGTAASMDGAAVGMDRARWWWRGHYGMQISAFFPTYANHGRGKCGRGMRHTYGREPQLMDRSMSSMRHATLWLRRADGMEGEVEVVCHATMRDGRERGRHVLTVCNLRRGVCLQFFCHIVNISKGTE